MRKNDYILQFKIIISAMIDENLSDAFDTKHFSLIKSYLRILNDIDKIFYKKYNKSIYYFL